MSTINIYGDWSEPRITYTDLPNHRFHQRLWDKLAAHDERPNFGLSQRKNEIIELWNLFQLQDPSVIVEIGVAQGGTFASWCQLANKAATIIGIDRDTNDCRPRPGDPCPSLYEGSLALTSQGGGMHNLAIGKQVVHAINGWSYEESTIRQLERYLAGRKIDFLFHDASHSADMFAKDWGIYWPMITDGGIFASHDIAPSADPKCNKKETWDWLKATATYSACYEYLPHPLMTEKGIGVLIK